MTDSHIDQEHPFEREDHEAFSAMLHRFSGWDSSTTIGEAKVLFSLGFALPLSWEDALELIDDNTVIDKFSANEILSKLCERGLVKKRSDGNIHLTDKAISLLLLAAADEGDEWDYDHLGDPFEDDWLGSPEDLIDARIEWVMRKNRGL